jgi:hypothetical protein
MKSRISGIKFQHRREKVMLFFPGKHSIKYCLSTNVSIRPLHYILHAMRYIVCSHLTPLHNAIQCIQILDQSDIMIWTTLWHLLRPSPIPATLWPVCLQLCHISSSTCHLKMVPRFIWKFDWGNPPMLWVSWIWTSCFACNKNVKQQQLLKVTQFQLWKYFHLVEECH